MRKMKSPAEVEEFRKQISAGRDPAKPCIAVCTGTGCLALGATKTVAAIREEVEQTRAEGSRGCEGDRMPRFLREGSDRRHLP